MVFGQKFCKFILFFGGVSVVGDTVHQLFSVLFGSCINVDTISASGNWVVRVWDKVGVFGHIVSEQRFETFVQPFLGLNNVSLVVVRRSLLSV